jgi:hypothetical protein
MDFSKIALLILTRYYNSIFLFLSTENYSITLFFLNSSHPCCLPRPQGVKLTPLTAKLVVRSSKSLPSQASTSPSQSLSASLLLDSAALRPVAQRTDENVATRLHMRPLVISRFFLFQNVNRSSQINSNFPRDLIYLNLK